MNTARYWILFFALLVFAFANAQHADYPVTRDLKGNARSMREEVFTATEKAGKVTKGTELSKVQYLFGMKKNLVERDSYDADGGILERYATNFDENGNMIEETEYNSDSLENRYTYRYDNKGNKLGWMSYTAADTEVARGSYRYDEKGRVVLDSLFDAKGKLIEWNGYSFDEQDHLAKESHYQVHGDRYIDNYVYDMEGLKIQDTKTGFDGDTKGLSRFKYNSDSKCTEEDMLSDSANDYIAVEKCKYDIKGNKTEDIKYKAGRADTKELLKYDAAGNNTEDAHYRADGSLEVKFAYKYDASRNKIEYAVYRSDTAVFERWTYKYDEQGNKTEECFYKSADPKSDDIAMKLVLEYDKNGNWIRETGFQGDEPISLAEREIVYYQ